jgi:hypothetical protein
MSEDSSFRSASKNISAFNNEHPLSDSHSSKVNLKSIEYIVPNFIGATLLVFKGPVHRTEKRPKPD